MATAPGPTASSVFLFPATRQAMSRRWAVATFFLIAGVFGFVSMLMGGMLVFAQTGVTSVQVYVITAGTAPWWTYPGLLVEFPNGVLALPFLATIMMIAVSIGVGLGMTVAVFLWSRLIALRRAPTAQSVAASTAAGLTPAFLALATIGACCSVTASTATGLGVVSNASGASVFTLLANNWYLWVFQLVVLAIALIAHEALLQTYGPLLGIRTRYSPPMSGEQATPSPPPAPSVSTPRLAFSFLLRLALLFGGLTWGLAGVALFATYGYPTSSATFWFAFFVQHELIAVLAVYLALMPGAARASLGRLVSTRAGWALRLSLLVGGLTLVAWLPPSWIGTGAEGLFNELFGLGNLPASVGAIAPPFTGPVSLALRWGGQFLFLGAFAILFAIFPRQVFDLALPQGSTRTTPVISPSSVFRSAPDLLESASLSSVAPGPSADAPRGDPE